MSDQEQKNQDTGPAVRRLTPEERAELRRDMAEASAWARAELARRRKEKEHKMNIQNNLTRDDS
ncbi:TPA: hypothetical protein NJ358_004643 [Vibrio parahaemolyticus]|nr:hypothetical protein [Salmonella enterica]EJE8516544.1 hypothetical protein [Vibrio parahaemolyticus]EJE8775311.1 hypothetical protein [Vibrio parahaemolyticus]HCG7283795.1 hypothetical protein [Vibrio parahaemolyticus]